MAKGRLGKPVEFGYKGQIVDNDDGIVLDHDVHSGNPADAPQLAPAIQRVKDRAGRARRTVTADRGYGEAAVDDGLAKLGFRTVVIPRKGNPAHTAGTAPAWTASRQSDNLGGQGVCTHNLTKIAALTA
jgi:IS5 family transposase